MSAEGPNVHLIELLAGTKASELVIRHVTLRALTIV